VKEATRLSALQIGADPRLSVPQLPVVWLSKGPANKVLSPWIPCSTPFFLALEVLNAASVTLLPMCDLCSQRAHMAHPAICQRTVRASSPCTTV